MLQGSGLRVELRPHVGEYKQYDSGNFLGTFQRVFDQWQIYVQAPDAPKPFRYGYVGKKPGSPINAIITLPDGAVAEIKSEVERLLAEKSGGVEEPVERRVVNPTGFPERGDDGEQEVDSVDDYDDVDSEDGVDGFDDVDNEDGE